MLIYVQRESKVKALHYILVITPLLRGIG